MKLVRIIAMMSRDDSDQKNQKKSIKFKLVTWFEQVTL